MLLTLISFNHSDGQRRARRDHTGWDTGERGKKELEGVEGHVGNDGHNGFIDRTVGAPVTLTIDTHTHTRIHMHRITQSSCAWYQCCLHWQKHRMDTAYYFNKEPQFEGTECVVVCVCACICVQSSHSTTPPLRPALSIMFFRFLDRSWEWNISVWWMFEYEFEFSSPSSTAEGLGRVRGEVCLTVW